MSKNDNQKPGSSPAHTTASPSESKQAAQLVMFEKGEGPWGIKGFEKDMDANGAYRGHFADTILFNNSEKISSLGYNATWVATFPQTGDPKIHVFRAADCWECEPGIELVAISVPSKKIERLPYPGTVMGVDGMDETKDYEIFRAIARMGSCGKFLIVGSSESRSEKSAPWKLERTWGLKQTATGEMEVIRSSAGESGSNEIIELLKAGEETCKEIPPNDTHQYL